MMQSIRRGMSAIIVVSLLMGLVACSAPSETDDNSQETTSTTETSTTPDGDDGPFTPYEEPISVQFVRITDASSEERLSILSEGWDQVETWEDNRWTRMYKEELNVDVEYLWLVNREQYDQKWKISMSSGDIPDISRIEYDGLIDLNYLHEADLIQEMGSVWENYASDLTKSVTFADGEEAIMNSVTIDGQVMGIPQPKAALDSYCYLWIRTDWLENLDLDPPTTMEEFQEVMRAFVEDDPDQNGVDDTYAYLLDKSLWYGLEGLFWSYGAYPDTWVETDDGSLAYGAIQPEMKDALALLQQMYLDGWLDEEFVVKDLTKAQEMVMAGKTGIMAGGHWTSLEIASLRENDPEADFGVFEWPSATGSPVVAELELGLDSVLAARSDFEHPEAVVKMLNLYYEKLYGETGDYSYWGNDAKTKVEGVWWFGPFTGFNPHVNVDPYKDALKVVNGEMAEEDLTGVSLDYYNNSLAMWEWERMFYPGNNSAGDLLIGKVLEEELYFTDNFSGASTETMIERWSQMEELVDTTMTNIITGQVDVDEGFDTFVADWEKIGGADITAEVNAWYNSLG